MAGETPGADRIQQRRRRLSWQDDRSTNKIYASSEVSAIQTNDVVVDGSQKPGQRPQAKPQQRRKIVDRSGIRSSNEYYASAPQEPTPQQASRGQLGPAARLGGAPRPKQARPLDSNASLVINEPGDVNGVMNAVVGRLQAGESPVVVYIQEGNSALLRRARAALDMLVTREIVHEDMGRDVRFSYTPGKAEQQKINSKLGAPAPREQQTIRTEDVGHIDPAAFLAGEGDDPDDPVVGAPLKPIEVDTSKDVPNAEKLDEDGSDDAMAFLNRQGGPQPDVKALVQTGAYELESTTIENMGSVTAEEICEKMPEIAAGLVNSHDELDRQVDTDKPVRAAGTEVMDGIGDAPEEVTTSGDIQAGEAMPGIGDTPPRQSRRPGRRSGRGS